MSPADHNKTLVVLYSLISGLFTLPLLISPLILLVSPSLLAKNLKSTDQVLIAIVIYCLVVLLALLIPATGYGLYKKTCSSQPCARFFQWCCCLSVGRWASTPGGSSILTAARQCTANLLSTRACRRVKTHASFWSAIRDDPLPRPRLHYLVDQPFISGSVKIALEKAGSWMFR